MALICPNRFVKLLSDREFGRNFVVIDKRYYKVSEIAVQGISKAKHWIRERLIIVNFVSMIEKKYCDTIVFDIIHNYYPSVCLIASLLLRLGVHSML